MAFNILIVDDSATVRAVINKALMLAGVDMNLVFCDISMPVMDGEEFVAKLKDLGIIESIPVVIVSSAGSEPRLARLMANGVRDFVQKPFTPERIREVVESVMGVASDA